MSTSIGSPLQPPANEQPVALDGQHTQAWTAYHQDMASAVVALPARMRQGVTDGAEAAAGDVGEYLTASGGGAVSLGNGTVTDVASLSLTAGDWSVEGNVVFAPTGTVTYAQASVNVVSATSGSIVTRVAGATAATQLRIGTGGAVRINVATPVTAYLVAQCGFTTGAVSVDGIIWARRCR